MDDQSQPTTQLPPAPAPYTSQRNYKKLIVMGAISSLIVAGIIAALFLFLNQKQKETPPAPTAQTPQQPSSATLPTAKFDSYTSPKTLPKIPEMLYEYTLKSHFSDQDLATIASNFQLVSSEKEADVVTFSDTQNPTTRGMLTINTKSGTFSYQNFGGTIKLTGDIKDAAKKFLASLGHSDDAIECNITYQISIFEDATYVECHRSWDKLGLPLVSVPGLYNLSETTRLSTLRVGYVTPDALDDNSIVNVSTGQNGKIRPNDFNTATFLIDSTGTLVSLDSTLRFITGKTLVSAADHNTALLAFSNNEGVDSFILPAGGGFTDLEDVFPQNFAESRQAVVDDFEIVYLESLSTVGMTTYTPVYLLRGTAQLTNGYTVKYVQTTSAVGSSDIASLAGTTSLAEPKKPIQIGTFTPTTYPTNPPTEAPPTTTTPNQPPVEIETNFDCRAGASFPYTHTYTVQLPDGGTLNLTNPGPGATNTLWVQSATGTDTRINNLRQQFLKVIENEYVYNYFIQSSQPDFKKVSDYGDLKSFYNSAFPPGLTADYLPPKSIFDTYSSSSMSTFFSSLEQRVMAIDNGGSYTGTPQLPYFRLALIMINIQQEGNAAGGPYRCYLSGGSPSLFLYSNSESIYNISITKNKTYADPPTSSSWIASSNTHGNIVVNGAKRDFLYYEFDKSKTKLTPTNVGYVVEKQQMPHLSAKIARSLHLTSKETQQLHNEFMHALGDITPQTKTIKVSVISNDTLSQLLPVTISPSIQVVRYHFLLSKADGQFMHLPTLTPIPRGSELLLELGASTSR